MKTNKILLFSFAAAMMTACADDEFVNNNGMNGNERMDGKLVEAGLLSVGRAGGEAETRAYNPDGQFVWMPDGLTEDGQMNAERLNQKIGLCWTGVAKDGFGAVTVADQKVYTNYEYEHVGWLDENADSPKMDPCDNTKLLNGAYIQGEVGCSPYADFEGSYKSGSGGRWNKYYYGAQKGHYTNDSEWAGKGDEYSQNLNLARGVFSTKNASVFEGEYLVYYPYTKDFTKGQIVAHEPTTFTVDQSDDRYAASWDKAFSIGYISDYAGGNAASGIAAKTLSGFLIAKLYNYDATTPADKKIKSVIFYSEGRGILYKQDLNAKACVDALKTGDLGNGESLYFTSSPLFEERTNAVVANLCKTTGDIKDNFFTVTGTTTTPATPANYAWVALPVLPQTIEDLQVILIDEEDKSCTLPMTAGSVTPNSALIKEINLATCTFVNEYLAVDEVSFLSAMSKIKEEGNNSAADGANKVKLLKDITMTFDASKNAALSDYVGDGKYAGKLNSLFFDRNITVYSACGAKLIVAANTKMHIKNLDSQIESTATDRTPKLTIDVPVVVEGAGCCGEKVAKLSIGGEQNVSHACTVILKQNVENYGTLALGNNAIGQTVVKVKGTLLNKFDKFAFERAKTKDAAQVYLLGGESSGNSVLEIEKLENEGTVNSLATSIEINSGDDVKVAPNKINGDARVVKTTIGTLENKVAKNENADVAETGVVNIGGLTEIYVSNLTNVCEAALIKTINVEENKAQSLIDGRLTVTNAATNNGIIDNNGVMNLEASPMENNGLVIDQLSGQLGGYYVNNGEGSGNTMVYGTTEYTTDLPVKGIYVSKVATKERFKFALTDAVEEPSCNIIEFVNADVSSFNLAELDPNDKLAGKDMYVATGTTPTNTVCLKAWTEVEGNEVAVEKSFGHCVTVRTASKLVVKDGILNTVSDVNVESNATFTAAEKFSTDKSEITIGGNLNNEGTTQHGANILTVKENLNNNSSASFLSKGKFDVQGSVTTAGTFTSEGDGNTVGMNFAQTGGATSFNFKTTTDIAGEFSCQMGTFTRKALGTSGSYRATVNVGSLGALTGTNNGGWPTVKK